MIIDNICFGYNTSLFNNSRIEIPNRGFIAITGSSGCGKSTLLKLIHGQIRQAGLIVEDGFDYMIYIDQYATLDSDQTITQAFKYYCEVYHQEYRQKRQKEVLKQVNLEIDDVMIKNLSSGQRKRLAIAIGIYLNPQLIILDEPTSSLDYDNKIQIMEILKELSKHITVLISSHDEDIKGYYDREYFIDNREIYLKKDNIVDTDKREVEKVDKINYRKLKKYQGKKAKRFINLLTVVLVLVLGMISFGQVEIYYQGIEAKSSTDGLEKNIMFYIYENVGRDKLPIDYEHEFYFNCGAIVDKETNNKIKELEHVQSVYPWYELSTTSYIGINDDIDTKTSNIEIVDKNNKHKKIVLNSDEMNTPDIVPYYLEDNRKNSFIDEITAEKLGITSDMLPAKVSLEVGVPTCISKMDDHVTYFENNVRMDETHKIVSNHVLYDKMVFEVEVAEIVDSDEYANYYSSNGGGGTIYVDYNILNDFVNKNKTTDILDRYKLAAEFNEEIIEYVPDNYIVYVDSVDNIKEVNEEMLKLNDRLVTYCPSLVINEILNVRRDDRKNKILINIIYVGIGVLIVLVLLYRFNVSYLKKRVFYENLNMSTIDIVKYVQSNILGICGVFMFSNILIGFGRSFFNNELYFVDRTKYILIYMGISLIYALVIYIINYFMIRKMVND